MAQHCGLSAGTGTPLFMPSEDVYCPCSLAFGGMRLLSIPQPSSWSQGEGLEMVLIAHGASLCQGKERKCWERNGAMSSQCS